MTFPPWFELLNGLDSWRKRSRALIDLCGAAEARLFIVLARVLEVGPDR